jgi:hypothetical protein
VATRCWENVEGVETAREVLLWWKAGNSRKLQRRLWCEGNSGEERKAERGLLGLRKRPRRVNGANTLQVMPSRGAKATRGAKKPIRSLATLIIRL